MPSFKSNILVIIFAFAYVACAAMFFLQVCDVFYSVPGYQCRRIDYVEFLPYSFFAILPAFFLPKSGNKPSGIVLWFVYYAHIISTILFYPLLSIRLYDGILWIVATSFLFSMVGYASQLFLVKIKKYRLSSAYFYILIFVISIAFLLNIILAFGFSLDLPSIDDVYGVRKEFVDVVDASGTFFLGYVVVISGFVLSPFLLLIGIAEYKKNKFLSISFLSISFLLSFSIYGAGGFKSIAFIPFVSLLIYVISSRSNSSVRLVSIGLPVMAFVAYILSSCFDVDIIFNHWYRRVYMVSGINSNYFYDYVSSVNVWNLNNAPSVISNYYYGTNGSANTGVYGDGFAKAQYLGMILNSFLLFFILIIIDGVSYDVDPKFSSAIFFMTGYAVANSSLTSIFFTYGLLFVCILFFIGSNVFGFDRSSD